MADELEISRKLEESIRQSKKIQGDDSYELSKSISLLSKINDLRDSSLAKVKSLNRETINTKDIQKELVKALEKNQLTQEKINYLNSQTSDVQKQNAKDYIENVKKAENLEKQIQRARLQNNGALATQLGQQLSQIDSIVISQESSLDIDERRLAAAIQANSVSQETQSLLKEELQYEKEISKSVGITGKAMGFFANKLGLGEKFYGKLVEKARDLNDQNKKLSFGDKFKSLMSAGGAGIGEAFGDPLTAIPLIGGAIAGMVKGVVSLFNYIVEVTSEATKFGRQLGMSTQEAIKLNTQFNQYSITQGSILANSRSMFESQIELGKALGVNNILSKEILDTNIQLKQIAGLDEETRARIAETSIITGKNAKDVTKSVLAQVVGLKQAAGISLNYQEILSEASKMGGYLGLAFAKYPDKLAKSLVTVKAMGVGLKELDGMADSFLDFESSISKEFEAQLLTGKALNLSKARELFLNNDLAGAAAEITSQVGSSSDFMKMNRIAAQSLAESMGMTRDSMAEMLKKQEVMSKLGAKDTDNAQKQYQLALKKFKTQEAMVESLGEEAVQNMLNASNQEKIAGLMDKIKSAIANFVQNSGIVPMIDKMINFISQPGNIIKIAEAIKNTMATVFSIMGNVAGAIMSAANFFGAGIDESIIRSAKMGGDSIRAIDFGSMAGNVSNASIDNQTSTSSAGASAESNSMKKMNSSIVIQNNVTSNTSFESERFTTNTQTGIFSVPQKK